MAVIPINLVRVTQNLQAFNLLESLRRNQAGLFEVQNQIATGQRFSRPSEDPLRAAAAATLDRRLDTLQQVERNVQHAKNALGEGENAMTDAVDVLTNMQAIALQAVGDTSSADERQSLAPLLDSALEQLVGIGNRRYLNTYLFSGHRTGEEPFQLTGDGVVYHGDEGRTFTMVDTDQTQEAFTISGAEFFGAVSPAVRGVVDLNPALTGQTRICELRGTTGNGVTLGRIAVSDGAQKAEIDLSGADTVGDVLDKLNAEMPPTLHAALDAQSIAISGALGAPTTISISDVGGGHAARDLGLAANGLTTPVGNVDLDPQLTLRTRLADLSGGLGLSTANGLTLRNGSRSATLDFTGAETIEDVLNAINQANVGAWARLAADGRSIEVLNRVSGSDLYIEENGGQLATALGIRSLHAGTELASLNGGRGISTVPGNDLRIVTADGTAVEVDLDGATTLQDVIDRLNTQGNAAISAGLASHGNGLLITDNTAGTGSLRAERANLSPALDDLGLDVPATGNTLAGRDINPVRVDSGFTALKELRDALQQDDTPAISQAAQRLEKALKQMQAVQGRAAAQAQTIEQRTTRLADEKTATQVLQSDVRDADLTETVVRFQQMQNALQANLSTAARVMNLSLLDFLR